MEIIIGKKAGFCFGVKRAVIGSLKEINKDKEVYCLGELVHNNEVIKLLKEKNITIIDDIKDIKDNNAKLIIRAHGIRKELYNEIKERNIELVDYTCPFVLKIHEIAERYQEQGYFIFVIGSKIHPEIIGTISYCGNNSFIIEDEKDLEEAFIRLNMTNIKKLLVIVQTTFSKEKFLKIESIIRNSLSVDINLIIKNTICNATSERQEETDNLSKIVDTMIIIGGKNSSNTKKLYDISLKNCQKTFLIETKNDLDINNFKDSKKIGIMAGASTPNESIIEVKEILERL